MLSAGARHLRLGEGFLLTGFAIVIACVAAGLLMGGAAGLGPSRFALELAGAAGLALMLAGAVFFKEARAFLRRNKPVA